jgi:hypothetical protein
MCGMLWLESKFLRNMAFVGHLQVHYEMPFLSQMQKTKPVLLHIYIPKIQAGRRNSSTMLHGSGNIANELSHLLNNYSLQFRKYIKFMDHLKMPKLASHCSIQQHGRMQKIFSRQLKLGFYLIHLVYHYMFRLD